MTIVISTPPYQAFYDSNGDPLNGGFIYTYIANTTTPTATYTDQGGLTECDNPIELDSAGRGVWWLNSEVSYKYIVKDSLLNTIETVDTVIPFTVASSSGSLLTINTQTDNYTLVLSDAGKLIAMNKGTSVNLTVPLNASVAFPTGTQILIENTGAGLVTVVATGGVTINKGASISLVLYEQWSCAALIKKDTNTWTLVGALT